MSHKERLLAEYGKKKGAIRRRLSEFRAVWSGSDEKIFKELCFCICTPQSKAVHCDKAVSALAGTGALYRGDVCRVRRGLKAVRFPNNKAKYIVETRKKLASPGGISIKDKISAGDIAATREWLVNNVKGIGYKEASHFLRNIGFGSDLAILDVHILRNMVKHGIISEAPKSLTRKKYLETEGKLKRFSKRIGIPMAELDLLFWAMETGHIFK